MAKAKIIFAFKICRLKETQIKDVSYLIYAKKEKKHFDKERPITKERKKTKRPFEIVSSSSKNILLAARQILKKGMWKQYFSKHNGVCIT